MLYFHGQLQCAHDKMEGKSFFFCNFRNCHMLRKHHRVSHCIIMSQHVICLVWHSYMVLHSYELLKDCSIEFRRQIQHDEQSVNSGRPIKWSPQSCDISWPQCLSSIFDGSADILLHIFLGHFIKGSLFKLSQSPRYIPNSPFHVTQLHQMLLDKLQSIQKVLFFTHLIVLQPYSTHTAHHW